MRWDPSCAAPSTAPPAAASGAFVTFASAASASCRPSITCARWMSGARLLSSGVRTCASVSAASAAAASPDCSAVAPWRRCLEASMRWRISSLGPSRGGCSVDGRVTHVSSGPSHAASAAGAAVRCGAVARWATLANTNACRTNRSTIAHRARARAQRPRLAACSRAAAPRDAAGISIAQHALPRNRPQ